MVVTDTLEDFAKEMANNHSKFKDWMWWDRPDDAENWTIVYTNNRDSRLLEQSNAHVIEAILTKEEFENDVISQRHSHWAVGWVDGYVIRVYREDKSITEAFKAYWEIAQSLENYPVLDEEDYSRRELEATFENVEDAARKFVRDEPPENWVDQLYEWLSEHESGELENRDDQGGYPSETACKEGLSAMGLLDEYYWPDQAVRCKVCGFLCSPGVYGRIDKLTLPEHAPVPDEHGYALSCEEGGKPCLGSGLDGLVEEV